MDSSRECTAESSPGARTTILERVRTALGLSREQLAARAGMSARSIYDIEKGRVARPRLLSREALARAVDLPEAVLFPPEGKE